MKAILLTISIILGMMILVAGCTQAPKGAEQIVPGTTPSVTTPGSSLANPAAVFCKEKNYGYEIRRNPDGSEYGVCIFPDRTECEEWAFYQGRCPAVTTPVAITPQAISPAVTNPTTALANPSAVLCISKNYTYLTRKNPDGSEYGVCIFPGGKECDAWAYFRGECNETTGK